MCRLAKERGVVGGETVGESRDSGSGAVGQQVLAVLPESGEAELMDEAAEPRGDQILLVGPKIEAEGPMCKVSDTSEVAPVQGSERMLMCGRRA